MPHKSEKLDSLLLQFMNESQARQFQDDLAAVDDLFRTHPVRPVKENALETIRTRMLSAAKHHRYWHVTKWCAAAAAVIIGAGLFVLSSPHAVTRPVATVSEPVHPTVQSRFWSDTLYAVVMETDPIELELADLTESIQSVRVDPYESTDAVTLDLLEIEEIESLTEKSNFWEG